MGHNKNIFEGVGNWNSTSQGIPVQVFYILGLIIIGTVIFFIYKNINQKKKNEEDFKKRILDNAAAKHIDGELLKTLLKMLNYLDLENPFKLFTNIAEYDRQSEKYLEYLLKSGIKAGAYEQILMQTTKIRSRLATLSKEDFKPINSTEDLYSGLEVQLEVIGSRHEGTYDTLIASGSKNNLVVNSPSDKNGKKIHFDEDTEVKFTFSREDDAIYEFTTTVQGRFSGSIAAIVFHNTDKIKVMNIRRYKRVNPDFSIKLLGLVNPSGDIHTIKSFKNDTISIFDISGGGLQINIIKTSSVLKYIKKDVILACSIYIPNIGAIRELKGRVLRCDLIEEYGYHICSLEFYRISSTDRCRILQGILQFISNEP
ncbi:MAG: hypothetical protein COA79_11600 [Planctomycetota bacterium]|nr:MAG: hypothetical protein COA79_11600 [Planctomycetota bacterium]